MQTDRRHAEIPLFLDASLGAGSVRLASRPVSPLKLAEMCRCGDCPLPVWNCPFGARYCGDVEPADWEALLEGRIGEARPASLEDAASLGDAGRVHS